MTSHTLPSPSRRPWPQRWDEAQRRDRIRNANAMALVMTLAAGLAPVPFGPWAGIAVALSAVALTANPGGRYGSRYLSTVMLLTSLAVSAALVAYEVLPRLG